MDTPSLRSKVKIPITMSVPKSEAMSFITHGCRIGPAVKLIWFFV